MPIPNSQPSLTNYVPFESIQLCGNTLVATKAIFKIGPNEPLRLGRNDHKPPYIWLAGPAGTGPSWLTLVDASFATSGATPDGRRIAVIQDAKDPLTVVMIGSTIIVSALVKPDGKSVEVPNLDLRPIGLNIFGDENGLNFGGGRFIKNTFHNMQAAFAAGFPGKQA